MIYGCVFCGWQGEQEETGENELSFAACPLCGSECQPTFEYME